MARKVHRQPVQAISEYEREQQAIRSNYERLKAERLAREADCENGGEGLNY